MQSASSNFSAAASGSAVVWAPPLLQADWAGDGYGGPGTIDDLSGGFGDGWSVTHALDDGMPSGVHDQVVDPLGQLSGPLVSGPDMASGVDWTPNAQPSPAQYFSPFNTASPVYGYDRDVAPMTLDHGLVTAGGVERVRVFTGAMADLQVTTRTATVQGISATNRQLQTMVQPPPINGTIMGLTGSWPVSYALAMSGVRLCPPPRTGCRWWVPGHGSLQPFLPTTPFVHGFQPTTPLPANTAFFANLYYNTSVSFVPGPFLLAPLAYATANTYQWVEWGGFPLAAGTDALSQAASTARLEFWVRGGADSSLLIPGGVFTQMHLHTATGGVDVTMGINSTFRQVFVTVNDGAGHTVTLTSTATLPTLPNAWYFVGCAYSVSAQKLWVCNNFTGTLVVETAAASTLVTTNLPSRDAFDLANGYPDFTSYLCVSEIQFTTGAQANPDTYPTWVGDTAYWNPATTDVVVRPSQNTNLVALAEPAPIRAIDLISRFAQAELACTRCDELDRYCYLPLSYWVETAQQTQVDALTSTVNIADLLVRMDYTRIRNNISLSYSQVSIGGTANVASSTSVVTLGLGTTTLNVTFTSPVVVLDTTSAFTLEPTAAINPIPVVPFLSVNTKVDGTGSAVTTGVTAQITAWTAGTATVQVTNSTGSVAYLSRDDGGPVIGLAGQSITTTPTIVTSRDSSADGLRGERGMSVTLPGIQDAGFAQSIADALCGFLALPRPRLERVKVFGDPRRQPGDLVAVQDTYGTKLSGLWRVMAVQHAMNNGTYEQTITAVQAWLAGTWDNGTWNKTLWSA